MSSTFASWGPNQERIGFLPGTKHGIQYTHPQSEAVCTLHMYNCFFLETQILMFICIFFDEANEIQDTGRLKNGSDQLIWTLYIHSVYPSVHKQLIRTNFEAQKEFLWFMYRRLLFGLENGQCSHLKIQNGQEIWTDWKQIFSYIFKKN